MRNRRIALRRIIFIVYAAGFAAAICTVALSAAPSQEATPSESLQIHATPPTKPIPSDHDLMARERAAFRSYTTTVLHTQQEAALRTLAAAEAVQAASEAANAPSSSSTASPASTSPTSTTTPTPAVSGDSGIPAAWWPTAVCEEGGRDDPNYGYFGIQEWNGFDGYPTAGTAPLSVQLAWEASVGQDTPPDAPGQCHGY